MKTSISTAPAFSPRSITITFESQEELDAFGQLFNYGPVATALERACGGATMRLYDPMRELGAKIYHGTGGIAEQIRDSILG